MEVCAFIQDIIIKNEGDTDWLAFEKNSSNYIVISYLYPILRFKFAKNKKYIIAEKSAMKKKNFSFEPCTMSEGGTDYIRIFFDSPFELEPLAVYILNAYKNCRESALKYFSYNKKNEYEIEHSSVMMNSLSVEEVKVLLISAEKRRADKLTTGAVIEEKAENQPVYFRRTDITINPINDRVPLSDIRNSNNWDKGFDDGFPLWERGDELRKIGDTEKAIHLFDKARYNGYCAPALFESYAMSYRALKDYDNEIQILDEGIEREKEYGGNVSRLEARRDKAIQLLCKQMEDKKKALEKQEKALQRAATKKIAEVIPEKPAGRAILQLSDNIGSHKKI